jgi:ribonuclease HII
LKRTPSLIAFSPDFSREARLYSEGRSCVVGVDEAGRGPLAGPVLAGAAVLPRDFAIEFEGRINDSKKLTHETRVELAEIIKNQAAWGLGVVSHLEIDEMNIRRASWEAMRRAVVDLAARFTPYTPDYVLADGLAVREMEWPWDYEAVVKGDAKCSSIAAASILAKVARDEFMTEMETQFPGYGFAKHKGYPTPAHYAALRELGACEIHRRSFGPVRVVINLSQSTSHEAL